jgi:hypothetical protein
MPAFAIVLCSKIDGLAPAKISSPKWPTQRNTQLWNVERNSIRRRQLLMSTSVSACALRGSCGLRLAASSGLKSNQHAQGSFYRFQERR